MPKPVKLTWRTRERNIVVEECLQILEGDTLYLTDGVRLPSLDDTLISDVDYVLFEDKHGLFGVPPDDVIKIEEV
jgi:hypothetical protein